MRVAGTCSLACPPPRLAPGLPYLHPRGPSGCHLVPSPHRSSWQNRPCSRSARRPGPSVPAPGAFSSPQARPRRNPSQRKLHPQIQPSRFGPDALCRHSVWPPSCEPLACGFASVRAAPRREGGVAELFTPQSLLSLWAKCYFDPIFTDEETKAQKSNTSLKVPQQVPSCRGPRVHALCGHYCLWDEQMRGGRTGGPEPLSVQ